jgi:TRAP-type C4-dicarboxylate transport system permease small subunit
LNFFKKIDLGIEKLASWLLVLCVSLMLGMSVLNIILRWFNATSLWFEPFIRHTVFLAAFLGGVLATGRRTHIGIDIIGKYFEAQKKWVPYLWVTRLVSLASFLTLVWLCKASIDFVFVEAKYGKEAFLGIHTKFLVAIIPFGLSLIAYRFFYIFINSFTGEGLKNLTDALKEENGEEA